MGCTDQAIQDDGTSTLLADNELADGPVLVASVWEVSPDNKWDLLGRKFLHSDLQWVGLALGRHENRCVHAVSMENVVNMKGQHTFLAKLMQFYCVFKGRFWADGEQTYEI